MSSAWWWRMPRSYRKLYHHGTMRPAATKIDLTRHYSRRYILSVLLAL
jgi:hypothetical protein